MIKQLKKIFSLVLVVMMVVLCVTGCSQSSPSEEEEMSSTEDSRTEKTKDSTSTKDDSKEPDEGEGEKTAIDALDRLLSGNSAYVSGNINPNVDANLREDLVTSGQHPYAVVITCSDSRVPPELIFNAGLGEVFVIRTAGNVVSDFEIGSVEYGVEHLGSPLVIVLGHTNCGAVTAAVEGGEAGGSIQSIVDEIAPSVAKARDEGASKDALLSKSIEINVNNSINKIKQSEIMREFEEEGKIAIIGGIYDIQTGNIRILD